MKILSKVWHFISLILASLSGHLTKIVLPAISVVEQLKRIVDNPALDFLTEATVSKWDEDLLNLVRSVLSNILTDLTTVNAKKAASPDDLIRLLTEHLRKLKPEQRKIIYLKTASRLAQALSDEDIKESEADTLVQLAYIRYKVENQ